MKPALRKHEKIHITKRAVTSAVTNEFIFEFLKFSKNMPLIITEHELHLSLLCAMSAQNL